MNPRMIATDLRRTFMTPTGPLVALEDVSLTVDPAEAVAVIGPNGAGKSTLLRIIAGTLSPTRGTVVRPHRTASLLELGVVLEPDLTGTENLDFAMPLFGVHDRQRISDIVNFAELSDAIDDPVKHWSDGMRARLVVSLAVHSDAELLIFDEVLAVGDASFHRSVLKRVRHLQEERGAAVLVATHSMALASEFTSKAIWMEEGRVARYGPVDRIVAEYLATTSHATRYATNPTVRIERATAHPRSLAVGEGMLVTAEVTLLEPLDRLGWRVDLRPTVGDEPWMRSPDEDPSLRHVNLVASTRTAFEYDLAPGRFALTVRVPSVPFDDTRLDAVVVLVASDGAIIDELSSEIVIGSGSGRPTYALRATPGLAEKDGDSTKLHL